MSFLNGKKTYLAGAGLIALGLYLIWKGDLPGGATKISMGFGLIGLGHGQKKQTAATCDLAAVLAALTNGTK